MSLPRDALGLMCSMLDADKLVSRAGCGARGPEGLAQASRWVGLGHKTAGSRAPGILKLELRLLGSGLLGWLAAGPAIPEPVLACS